MAADKHMSNPFHILSFLQHVKSIALFAGLILLAACGSTPAILPLMTLNTEIANTTEIMVATLRKRDVDPLLLYSGERTNRLAFSTIDVSIPKTRPIGSIEYPKTKPDLSKQFAATKIQMIDSKVAFLSQLNARLAAKPENQRTVFVFVHGYNVRFAHGLYRHAQIAHDYRTPGVALSYSWPSAGKLPLYLYDRESAVYARDGLMETLGLISQSHAKGVVLLAHSMGGFLSMEALRSLGLQNNKAVLNKIEAVVLAAPDIDTDVFDEQLRALEPLPFPMVLMVSNRDRALQASQRIRGGTPRVGEGANIENYRERGLTVIDLTTIDDGGDRTNHSTFASSPTLVNLFAGGAFQPALGGPSADIATEIVGGTVGGLSDLAAEIIYLPARAVGIR